MDSFEVVDQDGIRYLCSRKTGVVQGHMKIDQPDLPVVPYLRAALGALLLNVAYDQQSRLLVVGLGAGVVPRFILRYFPLCQVTVVEINPSVVETAQSCFHLPVKHPRLEVVVDCGFDYVKVCETQFDLVFIDGFDENAQVGPLLDFEFFESCKKLLKPTSTLVLNSISVHQDALAVSSRLQSAVHRRGHVIEIEESQNFLTVALPSDFQIPTKASLQKYAADMKKQTGLDLTPDLSALYQGLSQTP